VSAATLPAPAPTGTLSVHRELHDGACYDLSAAAPGITALDVQDADGDEACIAIDRLGARRLIEDLTLVAGLTPTGPTVPLAQALAGSARVLFERLIELDKTDPAGVDAVLDSIGSTLRTFRPMALQVGVAR